MNEITNKLKVIITGATGMVGDGVLHECLQSDQIEAILVIGRKPCGVVHPKLRELIVPDLSNLSAITEQLSGYNACFFCLGVSSIGMSAEQYYAITYALTLAFGRQIVSVNPDMTFCYISGAGNDETEQGSRRWARVKGKAVNDLRALPFRAVYDFRPGYLHPTPGLKHISPYYKYIAWAYPLLRALLPNMVSTLAELGQAMINVVVHGFERGAIEVKDIKMLARNRFL